MTIKKNNSDICLKTSGTIGNHSNIDPFSVHLFEPKQREYRKKGRSHWSVAWSDLMMTMFILFAIMYIYKEAHNNLKVLTGPNMADSIAESAPVSFNSQRNSFSDIYELTRKNIPDGADIDLISDSAVRITLTNDLLFETGQSELKYKAKRILRKIATTLKKNPYMINIVGHTDTMPIHSKEFPSNWELSAIRASVVARYLIETQGVAGNRFIISGQADNKPVVPNTSSKNRAKNRRVEIIISKIWI